MGSIPVDTPYGGSDDARENGTDNNNGREGEYGEVSNFFAIEPLWASPARLNNTQSPKKANRFAGIAISSLIELVIRSRRSCTHTWIFLSNRPTKSEKTEPYRRPIGHCVGAAPPESAQPTTRTIWCVMSDHETRSRHATPTDYPSSSYTQKTDLRACFK
jgi:hypothetical protein